MVDYLAADDTVTGDRRFAMIHDASNGAIVPTTYGTPAVAGGVGVRPHRRLTRCLRPRRRAVVWRGQWHLSPLRHGLRADVVGCGPVDRVG